MAFSVFKHIDINMLRYVENNTTYLGVIKTPDKYFTNDELYITYINDNLNHFQFIHKTRCAVFGNIEIELMLVPPNDHDKLQQKIDKLEQRLSYLSMRYGKLEGMFTKGCRLGFTNTSFLHDSRKLYVDAESSDEE